MELTSPSIRSLRRERRAGPRPVFLLLAGLLSVCTACAGRSRPRTQQLAPQVRQWLQCQDLYVNERYPSAVECCRSLLAEHGDDAGFLALCGLVDRSLGRSEEAMQKLDRALAQDASHDIWELYLAFNQDEQAGIRSQALLLEQQGHFAEAAAVLEKLDQPGSEERRLCDQGWLWLRAGQLDRAQRLFLWAASHHGKTPCGLRGLAMVARARGQVELTRRLSRRLEARGAPPVALPMFQAVPDQIQSLGNLRRLTRAEVALLLSEILPADIGGEFDRPPPLLDVQTHPYLAAVSAVVSRGWMRPMPDGLFHPERVVRRLEFGILLEELLERSVPWQTATASSGDESPPALEQPTSAQPEPNGIEVAHPLSSGGGWKAAFPELGKLWLWPPYQELTEAVQLLDPVTGSEAVSLLTGLWRPEWAQTQKTEPTAGAPLLRGSHAGAEERRVPEPAEDPLESSAFQGSDTSATGIGR